jgi:Tripartite tricarboxylate transporter TctB family
VRRPVADLVAAAILLAFGLAALWTSLQWPLGTLRLLGPGAMPALASLLIAIPMAALVGKFLLSRAPADSAVDGERGSAGAWLRIVGSLAAVLSYASALRPFGFLAATIALMLCLYALAAEGNRLRFALVAGLPVAVGAFALFDLVLNMPLPRGTLWGG